MCCASEDNIKRSIEEIKNKNDKIEKELLKDIGDLCSKLMPFAANRKILKEYVSYFRDIYRCFILHLKMHLGPDYVADCVMGNSSTCPLLQKLGSELNLEQDDRESGWELGWEDPGSILIKVVSWH